MSYPVPERPQRRVITQPDEVDKRLAEFGLAVEMLTRSIEVGDTARKRVMQPAWPATFAGVTMWADTLAELRRQLLRRRTGYQIGRTGNYETVYSIDRHIAFAVNTGDSYTGIDGSRDPCLTRPKGAKTAERIARNTRETQLTLIEAPEADPPPDEA